MSLAQRSQTAPRKHAIEFDARDFDRYSTVEQEARSLAVLGSTTKKKRTEYIEEIVETVDPIDPTKPITVGKIRVGIIVPAVGSAGPPPPDRVADAHMLEAAALLSEQVKQYRKQAQKQWEIDTVIFSKKYIQRKERKAIAAKWEARISNALFLVGNAIVIKGALIFAGPAVLSWAVSTGALQYEIVQVAIKVAFESTGRVSPDTMKALDKSLKALAKASEVLQKSTGLNSDAVFSLAFNGKDPFTDKLSPEDLVKGATSANGKVNLDILNMQDAVNNVKSNIFKAILPAPLQRIMSLFEPKKNTKKPAMTDELKAQFEEVFGKQEQTQGQKQDHTLGESFWIGQVRAKFGDTAATALECIMNWKQSVEKGGAFLRDMYYDMYTDINNVMAMIRNDTLASSTFKQDQAASGLDAVLQAPSLRAYMSDFLKLRDANGNIRTDVTYFFGFIDMNNIIGYGSTVAYNGISQTISSAGKTFFAEKVFPKGPPSDDDNERREALAQEFKRELKDQRIRYIRQGLQGDVLADAMVHYRNQHCPEELMTNQDLSALDSIWRGVIQRTKALQASNEFECAVYGTAMVSIGTIGQQALTFSKNLYYTQQTTPMNMFERLTEPFTELLKGLVGPFTEAGKVIAAPSLATILQGYRDELMSIYQKVYTKAIRDTLAKSDFVLNAYKWKDQKMARVKNFLLNRVYFGAYIHSALDLVVNGFFKYLQMLITEIPDVKLVQPFIQTYIPLYFNPHQTHQMLNNINTVNVADMVANVGQYAYDKFGKPDAKAHVVRSILEARDDSSNVHMLYTEGPQGDVQAGAFIAMPDGEVGLFVDKSHAGSVAKKKAGHDVIAATAEFMVQDAKEKGVPPEQLGDDFCNKNTTGPMIQGFINELGVSQHISSPSALCASIVSYYNDIATHSDDSAYIANKRKQLEEQFVFDIFSRMNKFKGPLTISYNGKRYTITRATTYKYDPTSPFPQFAQYGLNIALDTASSDAPPYYIQSEDEFNGLLNGLILDKNAKSIYDLMGENYTTIHSKYNSLFGGYSKKGSMNQFLYDRILRKSLASMIGAFSSADVGSDDDGKKLQASIQKNAAMRQAFIDLYSINNQIDNVADDIKKTIGDDEELRKQYDTYQRGETRNVDPRLAPHIHKLEGLLENKASATNLIGALINNGNLTDNYQKVRNAQKARTKAKLQEYRDFLISTKQELEAIDADLSGVDPSKYGIDPRMKADVDSICGQEQEKNSSLCVLHRGFQQFELDLQQRDGYKGLDKNVRDGIDQLLKQLDEFDRLLDNDNSRITDMSDIMRQVHGLLSTRTNIASDRTRLTIYNNRMKTSQAKYEHRTQLYKQRHLEYYKKSLDTLVDGDNTHITQQISAIDTDIRDLYNAFSAAYPDALTGSTFDGLMSGPDIPEYHAYQQQYKRLKQYRIDLTGEYDAFKKARSELKLSGKHMEDVEKYRNLLERLRARKELRNEKVANAASRNAVLIAGLGGAEGHAVYLRAANQGVDQRFEIDAFQGIPTHVSAALGSTAENQSYADRHAQLVGDNTRLLEAQANLQAELERVVPSEEMLDQRKRVRNLRNEILRLQGKLAVGIAKFNQDVAAFRKRQSDAYRQHLLKEHDRKYGEFVHDMEQVEDRNVESAIEYADIAIEYLSRVPFYENVEQAKWLQQHQAAFVQMRFMRDSTLGSLSTARSSIVNVGDDDVFNLQTYELNPDIERSLVNGLDRWNAYTAEGSDGMLEKIRRNVHTIVSGDIASFRVLAHMEANNVRAEQFGVDREARMERYRKYAEEHGDYAVQSLLGQVGALRNFEIAFSPLPNNEPVRGSDSAHVAGLNGIDDIRLHDQQLALDAINPGKIQAELASIDDLFGRIDEIIAEEEEKDAQKRYLTESSGQIATLTASILEGSSALGAQARDIMTQHKALESLVGKPEFDAEKKKLGDAIQDYSAKIDIDNARVEEERARAAAEREAAQKAAEEEAERKRRAELNDVVVDRKVKINRMLQRINPNAIWANRNADSKPFNPEINRLMEQLKENVGGPEFDQALADLDAELLKCGKEADKANFEYEQLMDRRDAALQKTRIEQAIQTVNEALKKPALTKEAREQLQSELAQLNGLLNGINVQISNMESLAAKLALKQQEANALKQSEAQAQALAEKQAEIESLKNDIGIIEAQVESIANETEKVTKTLYDRHQPVFQQMMRAFKDMFGGKENLAEDPTDFDREKLGVEADVLKAQGVKKNAERRLAVLKFLEEEGVLNPNLSKEKDFKPKLKAFAQKWFEKNDPAMAPVLAEMFAEFMTERIYGENSSLRLYDVGEQMATHGGDNIHDRFMYILGTKDEFSSNRRTILKSFLAYGAANILDGIAVGLNVGGDVTGASAVALTILSMASVSVLKAGGFIGEEAARALHIGIGLAGATVTAWQLYSVIAPAVAAYQAAAAVEVGVMGGIVAGKLVLAGEMLVSGLAAGTAGVAVAVVAVSAAVVFSAYKLYENREYIGNYFHNLAYHMLPSALGGRQAIVERSNDLEKRLFGRISKKTAKTTANIEDALRSIGYEEKDLDTQEKWNAAVAALFARALTPPQQGGTLESDERDLVELLSPRDDQNAFLLWILYTKWQMAYYAYKWNIQYPLEYIISSLCIHITYLLEHITDEEYAKIYPYVIGAYNDHLVEVTGDDFNLGPQLFGSDNDKPLPEPMGPNLYPENEDEIEL